MKNPIPIKGSNPIDTDTRVKALNRLNTLDTKKLSFLKKLVETPKAIDKLIENEKVLMQFI